MFCLAPVFGSSPEGTLVNVLSLAKVQMLERRGKGTEELGRSTILGPPPYLSVYSILCNRDSGFDGAEDIADYGLQIASSDGFIEISGPSGRYGVAISKSFQSKFGWLF